MFGPHVSRYHAKGGVRPSITRHIQAALSEGEDVGIKIKIVQIFIAGPRQRKITLTPAEAKELHKYILGTRGTLQVVAHGAYTDVPWSEKAKHAAKFIKKERELCAKAGITGLVIHLPVQPHHIVIKYLPRLLADSKNQIKGLPLIYLEVPASKPEKCHYEQPEKLSELFLSIKKKVDPNLETFGLCIDTAHLWTCGVNLSTKKKAENWLQRLERVFNVIPPSKIMFHLNDSYSEKGDGIDKHAPLSKGNIWGGGTDRCAPLLKGNIWGGYQESPRISGLAVFVAFAVKFNIPTILERKPKEALENDYLVLYDLVPEIRVDEPETQSSDSEDIV